MMQDYIRVIGRGKKGAKDLTYPQAFEAAESIINGEATDAQIGAFLMAARLKGESPDELRAMADVLRAAAHPICSVRPVDVELGGPFDGRERTFCSTIATALVLAAAGRTVALTGSDPLPPKFGVTPLDILKAMGMELRPATGTSRVAQAVSRAERSLESMGIAYLHLDDLCPPLAGLRPIRLQLGLRTLFNTAEKLLTVTGSRTLVCGVFHGNALERVAETIRPMGYERGLVVQGPEGSGEFHPVRRINLVRIDAAGIHREMLDPTECGFEPAPLEEHEEDEGLSFTAAKQAEWTMRTLLGEPGPWEQAVAFNAAVHLHLLGAVATISEGIERSSELLTTGAALERWEAWKARGLALANL